jgi:hypothetical protein
MNLSLVETMGDFDRANVPESRIPEGHEKSLQIAVVVLLLGVLAPFMMSVFYFRWGNEFVIMSMFWMYNQSTALIEPYGFSLIPLYALFSMLPFMLLRILPVYQIYRYYNGKTTRRRAFIASSAGDGVFLYTGLIPLIFSILFSSSSFTVPLPFQTIVAVLILWRFPIPEPTTPWEPIEKPKSWWEKALEAQQEKFPDDDDLREYLQADADSNHSRN